MACLRQLAQTGRRAFSTHTAEPGRFNLRKILLSEFIYGYGFQGPGALKTTKGYAASLKLAPGALVADLGCGTGGASFHLAHDCGANVVGVDLAIDMVGLCQERGLSTSSGTVGSTKFKVGSMDDASLFENGSLDLVWSRDALMYCNPEKKDKAFSVWFNWLKPGGRLFLTDFGRREQTSEEHQEYARQGCQFQEHLEMFKMRLQKAGFQLQEFEDISPMFATLNAMDLHNFQKRREEFVEEYSPEEFEDLETRWLRKVRITREGSQKWFRFVCQKPE
jgi:phosphoethanolamine N-methyltransferase